MSTPASVAKHPVHPMLVMFPIALWTFGLVCDLLSLGAARDPFWGDVAFYSMAAGLIGALAAAVPGFIDFRSLRGTRVGKLATMHMALNLIAVALFAISIWLRLGHAQSPLAIGLAVVGILLIATSGWLGGELVYVHGIGVAPAVPAPSKPTSSPGSGSRRAS
jgi:uncharacterized membrane protein